MISCVWLNQLKYILEEQYFMWPLASTL